MKTTTIIFNASDIETCQAQIIDRKEIEKRLSVKSIYRRQLRLYRRLASVIDAHPTATTALLIAEAAVALFLIILYA